MEDDSLFEGMILFPPNPQQQQQIVDDNDHDLHQQQTTLTTTTTIIESVESRRTTEALDEDLFSDLTLINPTSITITTATDSVSDSVSLTATASEIRQSQNRKRNKKKSSFKIGYARDYSSLTNSIDASVQNPDLCSSPSSDSLPDSDSIHRQTDPSEHVDVTPLRHNPPHRDNDDDEFKVSGTAESLDQLKGRIDDKVSGARELVSSVSSELKNCIRRRRKAAEDLSDALVKYQGIERELEEACEAEDFERAEMLSENLASAEKAKGELVHALRVVEGECDVLDEKMQRALELQITTEEECALLLDRFSMCAANDAESVLKKADIESSREIDDWLSSTEALQLKKMEMEIESYLIDEARKLMDSSIETSMEADIKEKERLCQKKDVLVDELEKLLALVKAKEKEIAENGESIKAIEDRIANTVSHFQEAKSSINARYDNIQSGLSQMELESESLSVKKKEIDNFIVKEDNRGTQLKELAKCSSDKAKEYQEVIGLRKSLMTSILKSRDNKARLGMTEKQLSEDVQELQRKVIAGRASLQDLSSTKSRVQQNITSFQERMFSISKRLPELEAEKKVAATARNFKEAARISAEAKSLTIEKDGLQNDLENAILQVEKLEGEIKETVNDLEETEKSILSKQKEVAMARFQKLLFIAGVATAERSAALELGFDEEASLYLVEAKAAETEAMKLKQEFDLKEDEFTCLPKHFISMELVSSLGREKLAELAASVKIPPSL